MVVLAVCVGLIALVVLGVSTLVRRAGQPPEAFRAVRNFLTDADTRRDVTEKVASIVEAFAPALSPVSPTPLNVEVGPHRRFDWTEMKVADLKAVKNVLGGDRGAVDLVGTMGLYQISSMMVSMDQTPLAPGVQPYFP